MAIRYSGVTAHPAGPKQSSDRSVLPVALLATTGIAIHLLLRFAFHAAPQVSLVPLYAVLLLGGLPLVIALVRKLAVREFGSDLLAGISILVSVIQGEYLVGSIVVLMLSGTPMPGPWQSLCAMRCRTFLLLTWIREAQLSS
jgi:cation transport ATPase